MSNYKIKHINQFQVELEKEQQEILDNKNKKRNQKPVFDHNVMKYAGKRFLGLTASGKEVWVQISLAKDNLDLEISTNHNLNKLSEKGAKLAKRRLEKKINSKAELFEIEKAGKKSKYSGGEVTEITLINLQKLINAYEIKQSPAFIEGKPTKLFFQYATSIAYTGNPEIGLWWHDVAEHWPLPSGPYFTKDCLV